MRHPLDALRRIRDDQDLTSTERLILMCAVLRTDNSTYRVRATQEHLAKDAGVTTRTIKTFYKSEAFQRYFETTKRGRLVLLSWAQVNETEVLSEGYTEEEE